MVITSNCYTTSQRERERERRGVRGGEGRERFKKMDRFITVKTVVMVIKAEEHINL